ncbi:TPA: peptidylprolyl isomerase [archaeon]|uniref:Peptidyl-prolyl cis-trans isomerase n=1 Tax=Candidatus Naiadarchaeum limnaeum TaxID=2756139 RepID=A0A832XG93_9ARCH|nr:peptidylprolyl isomerase [Candidatus Naiadarchaeum limnaeum]
MAETVHKGDFITIDYIARVKDTGQIFDLTNEETAKKEKIYREGDEYKPATVVVGAGHVLKGLDGQLEGLEIGKKTRLEVNSDEAFGPRNPELSTLVPRNIFKKQKVEPFPGLPVNIGGQHGIVQTVSGGRVRVDFNHPLAGKNLEYELTILKKVTDKKEQIKSLFKYHLPKSSPEDLGIQIKEKIIEITTPQNDEQTRRFINLTKDIIARDILKYIKDIEQVRITDILDKTNIKLD